MASYPVSPGKRRKDSLNQLRRDRPLFASRRPKGLQHQSEFFTESLNTSFIPSPSPKQSPVRSDIRPQPRRDRGSGRSLTSAFREMKPEKDEITPPTSSASDNRYLEDVLKPVPIHTHTRSPRNHNTTDAPSTPSPPRGRQGFLASPGSSASASSPPRGLAEAYQRIVDEENLAQDDTEAFDYTEDLVHRSHEARERVMQRKRNSESPKSQRTLCNSASREPQATDGSVDEEVTQHSSPRSSLDDATQSSIGSGLSQHAKDVQRVAGAINSDIKVFGKAKIGPRHSLSAMMLDRHNRSAESLHSSVGGSVDTRLSDPSMNVPRAWGRKSKPSKKWLDRIKSPSGRLTGDASNSKKCKSPIITESESRDWEEPIDKWIQDAAKTPLPVGEDPSQDPSSSQDIPQTTNRVDANAEDDARGWDNDDFTARSLQASYSPPLKTSTPTLGRMRSQELDSLEKRAVTTSRLVALKDQESRENLRRPAKEKEPEREDLERPWRSKSNHDKDEDIDLKSRANRTEQILVTPFIMSGDAEEERSQRPQHPRQDSHDLLRRLARSASNSPHLIQDDHDETPISSGGLDNSTTPNRVDEANDTPQQFPHKSAKSPKVTGGWVDTILENTPEVSVPNVHKNQFLKTPLVTGAWIDTPLPVGGRGPPMPTPEIDEDSTLQLGDDKRKVTASELIRKLSPRTARPSLRSTAPALPRSALESVITAAKQDANAREMDSDDDASLHMGDSTIASLEGILTNETKAHPPTPPSSTEDITEVIATPYTRQLKRLQSLVPSLRSTRKNISSLERAVLRSNERRADESEECHEGGEVHDFILPCSKCSGAGGNAGLSLVSFNVHDKFTTMEVPLPTLWTRPEGGGRPRLTWLGILTLSFWAWWILETAACSRYCHRPVSTGHFGFGFDYDAPEPPFVLEKVAYRSFNVGTVLRPLYLLLRFLVRHMASAVGYIAGLGSGGDRGDPVAAHANPQARGSDAGMMDDVYL